MVEAGFWLVGIGLIFGAQVVRRQQGLDLEMGDGLRNLGRLEGN
jgi:hypothetical protein